MVFHCQYKVVGLIYYMKLINNNWKVLRHKLNVQFLELTVLHRYLFKGFCSTLGIPTSYKTHFPQINGTLKRFRIPILISTKFPACLIFEIISRLQFYDSPSIRIHNIFGKYVSVCVNDIRLFITWIIFYATNIDDSINLLMTKNKSDSDISTWYYAVYLLLQIFSLISYSDESL